MFYAVLALLIYEPYASSKHSGVLAYFNKHFVKDGLFSDAMGRSLNKAFELRQRGDYREYFELTKDQVEPLLDEAAQFIATVRIDGLVKSPPAVTPANAGVQNILK